MHEYMRTTKVLLGRR